MYIHICVYMHTYKLLVILSVDVTNYLRDNSSSVYKIKYT